MRQLLMACGAMNLGAAILFAPPSASLRSMVGLPEAHPLFLWILTIWIPIFGAAYFWMGWTGKVDRVFMAVGAAGKASFSLILIALWLGGDLPPIAAAIGLPDLLLGTVFVGWLWQTRSVRSIDRINSTFSDRTRESDDQRRATSMPNAKKDRILLLVVFAVAIPIVVLIGTLFFYWRTFGGSPADSHDRWGQFGDLVGGVLNPLIGALALAAATWAAIYSKRTLVESQRETRSDRVFELYRIWTEKEMFDCRMKAWTFLRSLGVPADGAGKPVSLEQFRESNDATVLQPYLDVLRVYRFLSDVNALWDTGLIDVELVRALLKKDLLDWLRIRKAIEFRKPDVDPQVDQEQDWFTKGATELLKRLGPDNTP